MDERQKSQNQPGNRATEEQQAVQVFQMSSMQVLAAAEARHWRRNCTITANDKMSDAEIEQAIRDAEMYAASDKVYRDSTEVINDARKLAMDVEQAMNKAGKQLDKGEKKQLKSDIAALNKVLFKCKPEKMTENDITALRSAMAQLSNSSEHVRNTFGNATD